MSWREKYKHSSAWLFCLLGPSPTLSNEELIACSSLRTKCWNNKNNLTNTPISLGWDRNTAALPNLVEMTLISSFECFTLNCICSQNLNKFDKSLSVSFFDERVLEMLSGCSNQKAGVGCQVIPQFTPGIGAMGRSPTEPRCSRILNIGDLFFVGHTTFYLIKVPFLILLGPLFTAPKWVPIWGPIGTFLDIWVPKRSPFLF